MLEHYIQLAFLNRNLKSLLKSAVAVAGPRVLIKGTLMQNWKSANIFVLIWKSYVEAYISMVEGFTLKYLLLFEISVREICEKII